MGRGPCHNVLAEHVAGSTGAEVELIEIVRFLGVNIINCSVMVQPHEVTAKEAPILLFPRQTVEIWHVSNDIQTFTDAP